MSSIYEVHIPAGGTGGGPPPPSGQVYFAPKYLVGNVPAGDSAVAYNTGGFTYIPDPGDCSGIAAALLLPDGSGDVWVRPGTYTNGTGATLVVPAGVLLRGAGPGATIIESGSAPGVTQELFVLNQGAELRDLQVHSPLQNAAAAGSSRAVVSTGGTGAKVRNCTMILEGALRAQPWAIWDQTGTIEVTGTTFLGSDQSNANAAGASTALQLGPDPLVTPNAYVAGSYVMSDCRFGIAGGKGATTGYNRWVAAFNTSGGEVHQCRGVASRPVGGAIQFIFSGAPTVPAVDAGPSVTTTRITVTSTEVGGDGGYTGVSFSNLVTSLVLRGFAWDSVQVIYDTTVSPTVPRTGFSIDSSAAGSIIERGSLVGLVSVGHSRGIRIQAFSAATAIVAYLRVSASVVVNPQTIGAVVGCGIFVSGNGANSPRRIGIVNCSADGAPAGCFGINIADPVVLDTQIIGCTAVPAGGTAIQDLGTGTDRALNII